MLFSYCNNVGLERKKKKKEKDIILKKVHLDYYLHISEPSLQAAWRLLDNSAPLPGFLDNAYKIFFLKPDSEAQISSANPSSFEATVPRIHDGVRSVPCSELNFPQLLTKGCVGIARRNQRTSC